MIPRDYQRAAVAAARERTAALGDTVLVLPTGCHAPGTPILMFDGSIRTVEDVRVGDQLMGPDSQPRTTLELHRGHDQMVEVRPIKGDPFVVNQGHVLSLVKTSEGLCGSHRSAVPGGTIVDVSVGDFRRRSAFFRHEHKLYRVGVDFAPTEEPPLDPYFLGVLLGDGRLAGVVSITTPDAELVEVIHEQAEGLGLNVRLEQLADNEANTYNLVTPRGSRNPLVDMLRTLGLFGHGSPSKFVPNLYRTGSRVTRAAILAGLLDTDGHLGKGCSFDLCLASRRLADDIAFISRSLGLRALRGDKVVNGSTYHRIHISGQLSELPLRVVRKVPAPRRQKKDVLRTGFTIHDVGRGEYFGFSVDGDHRYVLGDFTVTHNSGKTNIAGFYIAEEAADDPASRFLVLQHTDELIEQNRATIGRVTDLPGSVVKAERDDWSGPVVFGSVQTLARSNRRARMAPVSHLVIDECHRAAADSYQAIIGHARSLQDSVKLLGLSATPERGDGRSLRRTFSNVGFQVPIAKLIEQGILVPPRTYTIDLGVGDELAAIDQAAGDFDMGEAASVLNHSVLNEAVVEHWQERAADRRTIAFCSTIEHAEAVAAAFRAADVTAETITGEMPARARADLIARFDRGEIQLLTNCMVLTEGFDSQPVGCIVILRPMCHKGTFIQAVGRGLRKVDPERFAGIVKTDCIVLDFAGAAARHGSIEQDVRLSEEDEGAGKVTYKVCPDCESELPLGTAVCPFCGHVWQRRVSEKRLLEAFDLTEIELLNRSPFRWCDLFGDDQALMASGFDAWGGVFFDGQHWHAVGKPRRGHLRHVAVGTRAQVLAAADDYLREIETTAAASKSRSWLEDPATAKQIELLQRAGYPVSAFDFGLSKYAANCHLSFVWNQAAIKTAVFSAELGRAA